MRAGHNMLHLTLHLMREDLPRFGIEVTLVDPTTKEVDMTFQELRQ